MTNQHPITPPPEMVQQWLEKARREIGTIEYNPLETMTDFRALCAELVDLLDCFGSTFNIPIETSVVGRARAALAEQPVGPTRKEAVDLYSEVMATHDCKTLGEMTEHFARAVLARWGQPAVTPPADGEVAELVEWLRNPVIVGGALAASDSASRWLARAATLLEQFSLGGWIVPTVEQRLRAEAGQQLEADCEWLTGESLHLAASHLRAAMRPNPPSLKEQALAALETEDDSMPLRSLERGKRFDTIRKALEALPND